MKRNFFAGVVGNFLEHYDSALYGLLGPFLAPHFFPKAEPISALILTYSVGLFGLISKPLGAVFFGYLGDRNGRKYALSITLIGMALVTTAMGLLPTYTTVGGLAPILLTLCRFSQSFFSAGERAGGAILALESSKGKEKSLLSSFYDSSSMLGIFLAAAVVGFFCNRGEQFWRIPFFLGSVCGLFGIWIRFFSEDSHQPQPMVSLKSHFKNVWLYRSHILRVALAAGFSYCTYSFSFTFLNGYLPFVTDITKEAAIRSNTPLLVFDFALLPLFGYFAMRIKKERLMQTAALLTALLAVPLYSMLSGASASLAIFVRMAIVTLGVAFAAPYHHWAQEQIPSEVRYTVTAVAKAMGSKLIGLPAAIVSLALYERTKWAGAPGLYLMGAALFAFASIRITSARRGDSVPGS